MTEKKDFFISYNHNDQAWAEWIAWQLESGGYSVEIQAWDWGAGCNFVLEMQRAAVECERILLVLSPNYLTSHYTQPEWAQAFALDPTGEKRLLIPVRVAECNLDGFFQPLVYIDFFRVSQNSSKDQKELAHQLRRRLLEGVKRGRRKPEEEPPLPDFPGATSAEVPMERDHALENYLKNVIEQVRNLDLFHLKHLTGGELQFPVDQIYTPLKVNHRGLQTAIGDHTLRYMHEEKKHARTLGELLTILFEQPEYRCMLVLGKPGSGKSTLLKYLTYYFATQRQEEISPGLESRTPFFLRLKEVLLHLSGPSDSLAAVISAQLNITCMGSGLSETQLGRVLHSNALILLDGLDEVADREQRKKVANWVKAMVSAYPNALFVVSSRVYGFEHRHAPDYSFTVEVDDFNQTQRTQYLQLWFGHVHRQKVLFSPQIAWQPEAVARRLAESIDNGSNTHLTELAANPLLLSMIAIVQLDALNRHQDIDAQLPATRRALYERCIELFINEWSWDEARGVSIETHSKFPFRELLQWSALLLQNHQVNRSDSLSCVGKSDLVDYLHDHMKQHACKRSDIETVLTHSHHRTLLLVEHGLSSWGFQHKTFQEYLCAEAIAHHPKSELQTLLTHVGEDHWRVVFDLFLEAQVSTQGKTVVVVEAFLCLAGQNVEKDISFADKAWYWLEQWHDRDDFHYPEAEQHRLQHIAWQGLCKTTDIIPLSKFHNFAARGLPALKLSEPQFQQRLQQVQGEETQLVHHLLLVPELYSQIDEPLQTLLLGYLDERYCVAVRGAAALALRRLACLDSSLFDTHLFVTLNSGQFYRGTLDSDDVLHAPLDGGLYSLDSFQIARYPVTHAQYQHFISETDHKPPYNGEKTTYPLGLGNHPVVCVSWHDAMAYISWLNKGTDGYFYQLPTEAQWERAARGPARWQGQENRRRYPWGDEVDPQRANIIETGLERTTAVGSFPLGASPDGVLDMTGNVLEWCADWYDGEYYKQNTVDENKKQGEYYKVLRGGSFVNNAAYARCAYRSYDPPDFDNPLSGFRVARVPRT